MNSRSPTSDQHLTDRHSRQSVMIFAWVAREERNKIIKEAYSDHLGEQKTL